MRERARSSAVIKTGAQNARHRHAVRSKSDSRRGASVLMYAAQQGNVDKVRRILRTEQPTSLYERDRTGKSVLHYTSTSDSIRAAQAADLLVMAAPDLIESRDEDGFTPLHLAVIAGNMQLVTFLLANKADVNAVDNEKHTVVHWATVCGETAALRAVLAAGAPVSTPDVHGGYPLHYAAQMCGGERDSSLGIQVLQALLAHGDISVSVMDGDKRQPLLWAASAGSAKAVLSLIRAGADVEACDKDGLTALHCAASRGHTDCIDTLLTLCGASPDVIDSNGCTALHYAVTLGHADATALLLAHGADSNRQDRKGRSPAHCGCAKGQFETVKLIGAHGANLWLRNARGDLPLHEAAASGRRDLVKWLLDMRPSQVNARNNDGRCPLHMAAINDNSDMCKILLDAGAQINPILRTSKNVFMTPLDCALQRGFRSTAKFLQLHGGVPASRLGDGRYQQAGNSAVSMQIRDDVTFWGDTSSDSERENGGGSEKIEKTAKRAYKKRSSQKFDRKKASVSGSDGDVRRKVKKLTGKDSRLSSSRISSNNEIEINGTTEITIHQTKEFIIDPGTEVYEKSQTEVVIPGGDSQIVGAGADKDRRPKSAKYSKVKTGRESSGKLVGILKDQSTNTSEETQDTVIEAKNKVNVASTIKVDGKMVGEMHDQQSIVSNTSEDVETQRDIVVEASVHAPPKEEKSIEVDAEIEVTKEAHEETKTESEGPKAEANIQEEPTTSVIEEPQEIIVKTEVTPRQTPPTIIEIPKIDIVDEAKPSMTDALVTVNLETSDVPTDDKPSDVPTDDKSNVVPTDDKPSEVPTDDKLSDVPTDDKLSDVPTHDKSSDIPTDDKPSDIPPDNKPSDISMDEKLSDESPPQDKAITELKTDAILQVMRSDEESSTTTDLNKMQIETKTKKTTKKGKLLKQPDTIDKDSPDTKKSEDDQTTSDSSTSAQKTHKSFRVLNQDGDEGKTKRLKSRRSRSKDDKKPRSKSEEDKVQERGKIKRSKIPTPINGAASKTMDTRVPSLPNIEDVKAIPRSDSNLSAPLLASVYSDNEAGSGTDVEDTRTSALRRKRTKRRSRRESHSAGSDYESSNLIDSGFEPSPRSTRIPKWRYMSDRGVNMASVTQTIQSNIRRYHLERKIFQHLLELKRFQIRSNVHNEAMLVKRAIDQYHKSCAATVGAGRYLSQDYTFKSFEKFLYESLRKLQKNSSEYLKGLPETPNPLHCTQSTNRCMHTTHAYTGVPCAAYLPKMDHHSIPKIGFQDSSCKPGTGFLPTINPKKTVTLELSHGPEKQVISLPTDRLDQNKRYYVTFTVKGHDNSSSPEETTIESHRHSKSD